jgi:hypothetical protein
MTTNNQGNIDTDRKIWADNDNNNIFVTETNAIGFSFSGIAIVMPAKKWHELAYKYAKLTGG